MPVFSYKARNDSGASVNGVLEALSEDDLLKKLQVLNYMPIHVGLERQSPENMFLKIMSPQRVRSQDIVMLNMRLACMADAGISCLTAYGLLPDNSRARFLRTFFWIFLRKCLKEVPYPKPYSATLKCFLKCTSV
jgi:type II secretory pathway component PulF